MSDKKPWDEPDAQEQAAIAAQLKQIRNAPAELAALRARHEKLREFLQTAGCHNGEYEWHQRDNSLCGWCNRRNALLEDE